MDHCQIRPPRASKSATKGRNRPVPGICGVLVLRHRDRAASCRLRARARARVGRQLPPRCTEPHRVSARHRRQRSIRRRTASRSPARRPPSQAPPRPLPRCADTRRRPARSDSRRRAPVHNREKICRKCAPRGHSAPSSRMATMGRTSGRIELDILKSGRLDFAVCRPAKPLLDAAEHVGLLGQRQPLAFSAPPEMFQPSQHLCFPPVGWGRFPDALIQLPPDHGDQVAAAPCPDPNNTDSILGTPMRADRCSSKLSRENGVQHAVPNVA